MRERVEGVGGVMHAGPTPTGWAVRVEIPRLRDPRPLVGPR
jgi:signal transduction histidine kinase